MRRNESIKKKEDHIRKIQIANIESRANLKEMIKQGIMKKFQAVFVEQQLKNAEASNNYNVRKEAQRKMQFDRDEYNISVAKAHVQRANEMLRQREANERRIA
jgi:hypothetical protein